jgi:hypothetical protein
MGLQDTVALYLRGTVSRIRRDAIAYAICAVCAVAVLILSTWASVLALLPVVGAIYAPLIVAGAYALIALLTIVWLQRANSRGAAVPLLSAVDATHRQTQFAQIAMIIEAVLLGYSMSRRR